MRCIGCGSSGYGPGCWKWGGQSYWYDGGHVGHVFSRRVQRVTERFLREVTADEGVWN
jgi:hypothetical protein